MIGRHVTLTVILLLVLPALAASADTLPLLILEDVDPVGNGGAGRLQYIATNPFDNIPVIAFAVEVSGDGTQDVLNVPIVHTNRFTWHAELLSPSDWDGPDNLAAGDPGFAAGDGLPFGNLFGPPDEDHPDGYFGPRFRTDEFGSYNDLFGDGLGGIQAAQVAFYFDNEGVANELQPGESDDQFFYGVPIPASLTLTIFDSDVPTFASGVAGQAVVPLPAVAWMGVGMLGLLAAVRRRRSRRS